ncbi:glycosyltransferase family 39 protein [Cloacibacillus sp. An23]|uniref:phospholipid carrier-dependent glycosyltransferase n=1 Tax=Cloacibacillus sp. An23 TaxID=1965591 RepID=UPI00130282E2|nr:glycosyltransferase family 39 protein [Cloacibacillus sp. An23]
MLRGSGFSSRGRIFCIAAALAAVLLYLAPLGSYPLMEPDEGRYAEIPREMIESGDYVTPRLNYVKYFEKPALLYWANAANFKIFGENEFAARLFPALCALGGAAVTAAFGATLYGRRAGLIAGAVTATSLLYFVVGTLNITDMPLTFFLTLAFASFYAAHVRRERRLYALFYLACALAVLAKGLVGVVLPGAVIFLYILITREWKLFVEPLYLPGIILFFAVCAPWFVMVCRENPDFFHFFFVQEHFLRYTTKMHGRYEPFWYFLPMVPAGLVPWAAFLPPLLSRRSVLRSPESAEQKRANIYLLLWCGVILLFYSMSDSKLIPYIVPCLPPLALLAGADVDRMASTGTWHGGALWWLAAEAVLLGGGLVAAALLSGEYVNSSQALAIVLRAVPAMLAMPLAVWFFGRKDGGAAVRALAVCALVFIWGLQGLYGVVAPTRTLKDAAQAVNVMYRAGDTVAAYDEILQGLSFYTGRRVMCVAERGELEFGASKPEAEGWFPTKEGFLEMWNSGEKNFILVVEKGGRFDSLFPDGRTGASSMVEAGDYLVLVKRKDVE